MTSKTEREWFTMIPLGPCLCEQGRIACPWCSGLGCMDCSGVGWFRCYGCDQFENSLDIGAARVLT